MKELLKRTDRQPNAPSKRGEAVLDLHEIKAITDLVKASDFALFKLEGDGFKMELAAQRPVAPVIAAAMPPTTVPTHIAPNVTESREAEKSTLKEIVSPMVGTFYRAHSPDSAPYVQPGQEINEKSVVCIIKALKVMNEIKAGVHGILVEVVVEDGTPVQFGQPLFRLK
jgi:acetyl-CoA carboxylase biotin carboxyl carrier protein